MRQHERALPLAPADTRAALARAAEAWGADWKPEGDGGRLALPVVFGLRRGVAVGRIEVSGAAGGGSRVAWTLVESRLELHRASVAVLALAVLPAIGALAWPFWPPLLALAPLGAVLGLLAWWLVVSRLRSSGPEDFLAALAEAGVAGGPGC